MIFSTENKSRKWFFCTAGAVVAVAVGAATFDFAHRVFNPERESVYLDLRYYQNVTGDDKAIALTFDDGPHPEKTREIMAILDKYQVPATFFFMGQNAIRHPEVVKEVQEAGFEIGNHTYTHSQHIHDSKERIALELSATNEILKGITGEETIIYRPPFLLDIGSDATEDPNTPELAQQWIAQAGYVVAGADIDSLDWKAQSSQEIVQNVLNNAQNGHIVLMHDGGLGRYTPEALETIIPTLLAQGYHFETVSEVLGLNALPTMRLSQDLMPGDTDAQTGGAVTALQTFLLMEGYYLQEPTGVFEETTRTALINYQQSAGVSPGELGEAGPLTRSAIALAVDPLIPSVLSVSGTIPLLGAEVSSVMLAANAGKIAFSIIKLALGLVLIRLLIIVALFIMREPLPNPPPWRRSAAVIVPVYNEKENIATTLESLLRSSYPLGEIIVVDDGSTDGSAGVARTYARKYPKRIRLIESQNGGKASALMQGVLLTRAEIVITMDGDTIFERHAAAKLLRHFNDEEVGAVAGRVCLTPGESLLNHFQHLEYTIGQQVEKRVLGRFNAIGVVPGPIGAWRRKDLLVAGGFKSDTLVEDQDATLAILRMGKRVRYEPDAVAYTEPPHTVNDFLKQRLRWTLGTLQCLWKYRASFGDSARPGLGLILLPHTLLFGFCISLLYPLVDLMLVVSLLFGNWAQALLVYFTFTALDLFYGALGLSQEKQRSLTLPLLPLQRLFYRFVMYYVIAGSIARALEGTGFLWNKVVKFGETRPFYRALTEGLSLSRRSARERT